MYCKGKDFNFALATFVMEDVYRTYHLGSGEGSQGSTPHSCSVHQRIRWNLLMEIAGPPSLHPKKILKQSRRIVAVTRIIFFINIPTLHTFSVAIESHW